MFIAGRDPAPVIEDMKAASVLAPGFLIDAADIDIDRDSQRVTVTHPGQPARTAVRAADNGCVILPAYDGQLHFTPRRIPWRGPKASARWPVGEKVWRGKSKIDRRLLEAAMQSYIARQGTRAVVVVHKGELVGEMYDPAFGPFVQQRSWSTAKSVTASLTGLMVDRGRMKLDERPPLLTEWDGDGRRDITLRQLLTMSSGLKQNMFEGTERSLETFTPQSEHAFIYFDGFDTYADALEAPLEVAPGSRWQYRNANVLATAASIKRLLASDGQDFSTWAQRRLLEPLGHAHHHPGDRPVRAVHRQRDRVHDRARPGPARSAAPAERTLERQTTPLAQLGPLRPHAERRRRALRRLLVAQPRRRRSRSVPRDAYYASGAFGQNALVIPCTTWSSRAWARTSPTTIRASTCSPAR